MPRPPRAEYAGAIYHTLNRGNVRNPIFFKEEDYDAIERLPAEGSRFRLGRLPNWVGRLNQALTDRERNVVVRSIQRRAPYDGEEWGEK